MNIKRNTFIKKVVVLTVLLAVMTIGVFAQAERSWESPQFKATKGRIRSEADDFIRPDSYNNVDFDRWYSLVSFDSNTLATLGYATKLGGLYIGAFYRGDFWANLASLSYTEQDTEFAGETHKTVPVYGGDPTIVVPTNLGFAPTNQIAVLVGVGDMGFRLSFLSTYKSFKKKDVQFTSGGGAGGTDPVDFKSIEAAQGNLSPQLAWGMTKNLTDKGIKPWATIELEFHRNWSKYEAWNGTAWSDPSVGNSENSFTPSLGLGLGGYTLADNNGWKTTADLEYYFNVTMYNNEYDHQGSLKKIKGTFDGTDYAERSDMGHSIRPSIATAWNGDSLRLRAKLNLRVDINSEKTDGMTTDASGGLQKAGQSSKEFELEFRPSIQLGAQYQVASKLILNAGGEIAASASRTTTESSTYTAAGKTDYSDRKFVETDFNGAGTSFSLGLNIPANDNVTIDSVTGVSSGNVSFFGTGGTGLFVFNSILVSLKF